MKDIITSFITECMKLKFRIPWITFALFIFVPMMMSLMVYVTVHPEIGAKLGIIGTKAGMLKLGKTDWNSYLGLLNQMVAAIGMVGFGFVTSWVFGREYSDRTIKDILALPVSRTSIVISKFLVVFVWCILLAITMLVASIIMGFIIKIPEFSYEVIVQNISRSLIISFLTLFLCTPVAFLASYGRGYLLPMSFVILTLIIANFTGLVGLGPYFPWAIPGIYSVSEGEEGMELVTASYYILMLTSLAGFAGTIAWWRYADQH